MSQGEAEKPHAEPKLQRATGWGTAPREQDSALIKEHCALWGGDCVPGWISEILWSSYCYAPSVSPTFQWEFYWAYLVPISPRQEDIGSLECR